MQNFETSHLSKKTTSSQQKFNKNIPNQQVFALVLLDLCSNFKLSTLPTSLTHSTTPGNRSSPILGSSFRVYETPIMGYFTSVPKTPGNRSSPILGSSFRVYENPIMGYFTSVPETPGNRSSPILGSSFRVYENPIMGYFTSVPKTLKRESSKTL